MIDPCRTLARARLERSQSYGGKQTIRAWKACSVPNLDPCVLNAQVIGASQQTAQHVQATRRTLVWLVEVAVAENLLSWPPALEVTDGVVSDFPRSYSPRPQDFLGLCAFLMDTPKSRDAEPYAHFEKAVESGPDVPYLRVC